MSSYEFNPDSVAGSSVADQIDVDIYCLFCGYNLRGLSGNRIRCPECGGINDRRVLAVPAEFIRGELQKMETAPSSCVGVSVIALLLVFPLLILGEYIAPILIIAVAASLWFPPYFYMKKLFENQCGWRSILRDFHLATACWALGIFLPLFFLLHRGGPALPMVIKASSFLLMVGLFPLGMSFYRKGQKQIDMLQRGKAVALAQRYFQRINSIKPDNTLV